MCPSVSGITSRDAALSAELGMRAIDLAVGRPAVDHTENPSQELQSYSSASVDGVLRPGGHLIVKLLESEDNKGWRLIITPFLFVVFCYDLMMMMIMISIVRYSTEFIKICKPLFRKASWLRPKATRSSSREIYLICQGFR